MRLKRAICCLILIAQAIASVNAQALEPDETGSWFFKGTEYTYTDSGMIIKRIQEDVCKLGFYVSEFIPNSKIKTTPQFSEPGRKVQLLTIHGNISYDFFYRSRIDTPISQNNFQQHTERINLDIMVKEKYPLKVSFISRQSNSPFFRNFLDMNLNFDRYKYNRDLKEELIRKVDQKLKDKPDLKKAEDELKEKIDRYNDVKNWLNSPATLQKIIEEKERLYNERDRKFDHNVNPGLNGIDSIRAQIKTLDSLPDLGQDSVSNKVNSWVKVFDQQQKSLAKLADSINALKGKTDSLRNVLTSDLSEVKQKIYRAKTGNELRDVALENGINQEKTDKLGNILSGVRTFGIGKSMLNYTELTAQNISITGVNIEFNPSYYIAFAAGTVDYRFRDFYNRNTTKNQKQYLVLGRIGIGSRESNALILSVFQGRKSTSQYGFSDSVSNHVNVLGYSIEAIFRKDEHTSISAEFAKSTKPVTGNLIINKQADALFKFSDNSNAGINIKAQTHFATSNTKLSGFYRRTGTNFQSFSLFSYNTDQTAWLIRADQPFLRNKVSITGMLRQNDFTNPFTDKTYKTSTVFKSVILNVRLPKYPSFSVGYYPGTQLYFVNKEKIKENAYYILNGSIVYGYYYKEVGMTTTMFYNRYFNKATDSGFVLNKGINYYASQNIVLGRTQARAGYSYTRQTELSFYTLESSLEYALKSFLKVGSGLKSNKVYGGERYWGHQFLLNVDAKKLGGLMIQYEKSYLPTLNNTLVAIEIGRVSWYKIF